ncbi:MAG TPA: hypothetical protein PKE55_00120 [Kiritimatiellia bacterium]|nr:hypothetical protein [Kiritimatiellia bacterium]
MPLPLIVPRVPDPCDTWPSRHASLTTGLTLDLLQSWLPHPDPRFQPGTVRLGRCQNRLLILATLRDLDIHTDMERHNQPAWLLGDTFEIFLKPQSTDPYLEFHVTPRNFTLNYRFPHPAPTSQERGKPVTLPPGQFAHDVDLQPQSNQWHAWADIPLDLLALPPATSSPLLLQANFARYDATRGHPPPILSATAPLTHPDFHHVPAWHILSLE